MKTKALSISIVLIIFSIFGVACLSISINNSWKVPNSDLSVTMERRKNGRDYTRILNFEENRSTKQKFVMATENGDYSRTNIYRISDKTYLIKDFWNDYEINTETKTLRKLDAGLKTGTGGEYLGAFDENESGGWRFIPVSERAEIPLGEKRLK